MSFLGIYDADGGLGGELRYVAGKLMGRGKCALCDITHGWNPMGSKSWKQVCAVSDVELELLHRNEVTAEQLASANGLPAILRMDENGQWREAIPASELSQYVGAPDALLERLEQIS